MSPPAFGLVHVRVRDFRSARDVTLAPHAVCALVGEASSGKSNLLAALRLLLDPGAPELRPEDRWRGDGPVRVAGRLADGSEVEFPPAAAGEETGASLPAVLFLPADLRSETVFAPSSSGSVAGPKAAAEAHFASALADRDGSAAAPALAFVTGLERCCESGLSGIVLLVEEPELFLRPQAQRYLHRLLHTFAEAGNQVVFSTHSPAFLSVAHLEELVLVGHDAKTGTQVVQPEPLLADEAFRVVSEFDAERSELFLAHAALLVEGRTEKLVFPFVFQALGFDSDREAISIVECGGKSNIPLFVRICDAVGVPCVAVHDRDAEAGQEPIHAEQLLNALIAETAGPERTVVLEPDFEGATGVPGHKPQGALRRFADVGREAVPEPLARAARLALAAAGLDPDRPGT